MNFTNTAPGVHVPGLMIICKIMFVYYWVYNNVSCYSIEEFAKKQCRHPHANIVTHILGNDSLRLCFCSGDREQ